MGNAVMLDLETWGTTPGSASRSIGAVEFDPYGASTGREFYANIDDASCFALGLTVDKNTALWWTQQEEAAQKALLEDPQPLPKALEEFNDFLQRVEVDELWAHGASFDPPILAYALGVCKIEPEWPYRGVRDTRTLFAIAGYTPGPVADLDGVLHNALDDAKRQAAWVQEAMPTVGPVA